MYIILLLFIAYTYDKVVLLNFALDFTDFKTLNVCYSKTTSPIELKITGSIKQVNKSLYINFQVNSYLEDLKIENIYPFAHFCVTYTSEME